MKQKESVNPESSDSAMSSDFDGQLERIEEYTKRRVPVITGLLLKSKSNKMYYRNKSVKIPKTGGDGAGDQIYKAWSEVADEAEIEQMVREAGMQGKGHSNSQALNWMYKQGFFTKVRKF